MKMKKLTAILSAIALCATTAYASGISIERTDSKITVELTAEAGEKVRVAAVKADKTLSDTDWVCALKEGTADADGKVTVEFYMPETLMGDISDGEYTVYVKADSADMATESFWYAAEASRIQLEADLATLPLSDIVANPDNETALKGTGFEMDIFNGMTPVSKTAVITATVVGATAEDTAKSFNENVLLTLANSGESNELLKNAVAADDVASDCDAELVEWVAKCVDENKPYATYTAVEKIMKDAKILDVINNTRFSQITEVLAENEVALGLNVNEAYLKYKALTSKDTVNEKIAAAIREKAPTSTIELAGIIDNCLPEDQGSGSNPGGSNPGGGSSGGVGGGGSGGSYGGGSGGSSGGLPAIALTPQTPVTPEVKPDVKPDVKPNFTDMAEASWAEKAVNAMYEKGIVSGDGNGSFRPNDAVTREEFIKMIIAAAGLHDEKASCAFADVAADSWANSYIASAVNNGIINGITENSFGFGNTLTREDMAVICARIMAKVKPTESVREDTAFADADAISDYAKESVSTLYRSGLINGMGDGSFAPKATATRAQAAQMIYNLFANEE